jgi:4-amino-4-deoxy-L-arabinose transferase-like glycosyltransferase
LIIKKKKIIELNLFLPIIIFLLILIPHLNWLFENNFSTISYALDRTGIEEKKLINHFINPIIFIIKQFLILIPFLIVFFLIYEKNKKRLQINIKDKNFLFLTCVNILPILMVFCISIFTGAKIRTMWMSTFYLLSGTYLFYLFENKINLKKIKKFFYSIIFLFIFSPLIYLYVSLSNDFKRTDYPGKEIASLIQNKWDRNFVNEIKFVIGDEWAAGNLSYHLSSRPIWMYDLKDKISVINKNDGVIYAGNPDVLKKVCPGVFGAIKPIGYCLIGNK